MEDNMNFEISIPTDNEGFVLLKCPICWNLFKLKPGDFQSDNVFSIYCPSCGLISDNYITEDVLELALKKANNYLNDYLLKEFKEMGKKLKVACFSLRLRVIIKEKMNNQ